MQNKTPILLVGTRVYWHREPRSEQSKTFNTAVISGESEGRFEIELRGRPNPRLPATPVRTFVNAASLRLREEPCFAFDEEMKGLHANHCIEAVQVSSKCATDTPFGLWSGRIEGINVTLPTPDPDLAYTQAVRCLMSGQFAVMLKAGIQKLQSRRSHGWQLSVIELNDRLILTPKQLDDQSHSPQIDEDEDEQSLAAKCT